jgi:hypothetical protein
MEGQDMSRVVSPTHSQPGTGNTGHVAHEKIAMRAYEKWCKRGRPQGTDKQDWSEAEAELRREISQSQGSPHLGGRH